VIALCGHKAMNKNVITTNFFVENMPTTSANILQKTYVKTFQVSFAPRTLSAQCGHREKEESNEVNQPEGHRDFIA